MSWHFSLALVEDFSVQGCLDGEQCVRLSGNRTALKSSVDDKKKDTSARSQYGTMYEHSMVQRGVERWISLLPDSHVSRSQSQDSNEAKTTNGTCGLKLPVSFAKYDPDTACWRTYQASLFTNTLEPYSETWPRAGTVCGGIAYLRQPLAPRTAGTGCGSLRERGMWPTPKKWDGEMGTPRTKGRSIDKVTHLGTAARYWPTPRAQDGEKMGQGSLGDRRVVGGPQTPQTWPTPIKRDARSLKGAKRSPNAMGTEPLVTVVGGALNPDWVEWLMGVPIGWSALRPLETRRFRQWLKLHGGC